MVADVVSGVPELMALITGVVASTVKVKLAFAKVDSTGVELVKNKQFHS